MRYLLMLIPLAVTFHGFSYGMWSWRQGNRLGGVGVTMFTALTLASVIYMVFFHKAY